MLDIVKTLISSVGGSFAVVFASLIIAAWLIHYVTKYMTKHTMNLEAAGKKVSKLEDNIDSIKNDINYIKGVIGYLQTAGAGSPTKSKSPISLSEIGEHIAAELGLKQMISGNFEKILTLIDTNTVSKNAYDIQQYCIETATISLEKLFTPEQVDKIKQYAFDNGNTIPYYGGMIGVMVRDAYFKHKNMNVSDVDKHDPYKSVKI
ncbi:hypothetical protein FACS189430_03240 [Bacteroidia bacterium]|nr:hypothetical protein FACS189430_03240 [Bacteroidia bacterium]